MTDTSAEAAADPAATRRRRLIVIGAGLALIAVAWALWCLFSGNTLRSTDDAYINGHVILITPRVAGAVSAVLADNTDRVRAGQTLVELDPSDARIELASAQAALAQAIRRVRGLFAATAQAAAMIQFRQAELERAQADLRVRQAIVGQGAVTEEATRHARDAVRAGRAALDVAEQAYAEALSQTKGTSLLDHPEVRAALERVRAAELALQRTTIHTPVSGMVAQRNVQLGERVAVGDRLMAVVPLDQLWVDANFKEVQLEGVCRGQPARVTADIYGDRIVYHGTVDDVEAGSGAAFSLLPPQNATGNWIKVVQRVPVRIRLNPAELARHPLRIGMSADVQIDTSRCPPGTDLSLGRSIERTAIYAAQAKAADQLAATAMDDDLGENDGSR